MRILIAHNSYQQRGGEDVVLEQDTAMLVAAGFDVRRFTVNNDYIVGLAGKFAAARSVVVNKASVAAIGAQVAAFAPDVVHFHNFFPTLSPAAIDAVARQNVPVVLTLHNFRLICPGVYLLRDGKPCEDCVGKTKLPGVMHGCYRGSRIGSALVGVMGAYFRALLKKHKRALTLIALTEFAKSRFLADGFPAGSITVRGNTIADPGCGLMERERRIVYVGRLSYEKGVDTLLRAARGVDAAVEIIGDGPERARLEAMAPSNVLFRGSLPASNVMERIKSATALALPSRSYEGGQPMAILEAMATGTPVLASRLGSLAETVVHKETGFLIAPNDVTAWHTNMLEILREPHAVRALGARARTRYLEKYSVGTGLTELSQIYESAQRKMSLHS